MKDANADHATGRSMRFLLLVMKRPRTSLDLAFFLLLSVLPLSNASSGDRSFVFQRCLSLCIQSSCPTIPNANPYQHTHDPNALLNASYPLSLRLTRWTCQDNCAYDCMHQITDSALALNEPVQQYYGKWPFWRWMGMQEPGSVFFSFMNFWVHARGYKEVRKRVPDVHVMKRFLVMWSVVNMNAWLCSAAFHVRDKPMTEKLDYFSAALVFIVALYTVVARFFLIGRPARLKLYRYWTLLCLTTYIMHVTYLSVLPRFDYTYNIVFNLVLGLAHNLLWVLYALPSSWTIIRRFPPNSGNGSGGGTAAKRDYRPRCAWKVALGVALTMSAMALELLDFPPIGRVLDAHALWHAATAPIAHMWYGFLIEDALDEGWNPGSGSGSKWKVERL